MSTLAATFDPTNSRVTLTGTSLGSATTCTMFSRLQGTSTFNVVRGAISVTVTGGVASVVYDYEFPVFGDTALTVEYVMTDNLAVQSNTATAVCDIIGEAWLKFPGFPFLNQRLDLIEPYGDVQRSSRGALLPTVANRRPLAVQEYMTGYSFDIIHRTATFQEWQDFDVAVSLGSIVYFHCDENAMGGLPSIYAVVDDAGSQHYGKRYEENRLTKLSLTEVATPSAYYAGSSGTWQSVLNGFATWTLVLSGNATWEAVLATVGSPSDIIVS